ncbi:hypothetical protein ACI65C_002946 [Semiaphis heraclei]
MSWLSSFWVVLASWNVGKAEKAMLKILVEIEVDDMASENLKLVVEELDLVCFVSVKRCEKNNLQREKQIHLLVNNADEKAGEETGLYYRHVVFRDMFYFTNFVLPSNGRFSDCKVDRMVKFIEFEADEIEQNIDTQSEDEYRFKKNEMILKGKMEVNQLFNKKTNLMNRKTAKMTTTQMTSARLEILNTRDKYIKSVLADVNKELLKMRNNRLCYYQEILKQLILQAMYQVLEEEVCLILITDDEKYVTSIIPELRQIYLANTGINVKLNIDKSIKLPTQEIGGAVVTDKSRKLIVENTLVVRLLNLTQQAIPIICTGLFGPNPTRNYLRDT